MQSNEFEKILINSDKTTKKTIAAILNNIGKTIAIITLTVATLVTFTDVSFTDIGTKEFTSQLILMCVCATVLYFSLEDAGQRLGMEEKDYLDAKGKYECARDKIDCICLDEFKKYLDTLAIDIRKKRQRDMLLQNGLGEEEFKRYKCGEQLPKKRRLICEKADRIRLPKISAKEILSHSLQKSSDEYNNPKSRHFANLCLKIMPSLACMTVTVSIMLTAKDDLSWVSVISGIMKLSPLPIIGLRGYLAGYNFIKEDMTEYLITKKRIIEGFISRS